MRRQDAGPSLRPTVSGRKGNGRSSSAAGKNDILASIDGAPGVLQAVGRKVASAVLGNVNIYRQI